MGAWHAEMFPAMGQAEEWMLKHRDVTFPIDHRLEVPVLCLRWTGRFVCQAAVEAMKHASNQKEKGI